MPAITSTNVANAIVKLVAVDALPALMGNLVMGNLVNRDFEPNLGQVGETVNVPIPPILVANNLAEGGTVQTQNPDLGNAQIVLNTHAEATFQIPDVTKVLAVPDLLRLYMQPAVVALAERIETDLLSQYASFTANSPVGAPGTPITEAIVDGAETTLFQAKVPASEPKFLVVDADSYSQLRQITRFSEFLTAGDAGLRALIDGSVGKIKGTAGPDSGGKTLSFASPHGLTIGQALTFGGEIRFVSAIADELTVILNAEFSMMPSEGSPIGSTVTYLPSAFLKSVSILDYWDPADAVQRILCGAAVDKMRIRINGDFHEFAFSGQAMDVIDSSSFSEGQAGMSSFPPEPVEDLFDYTIIPGHLGQAWLGSLPDRFFTITEAELLVDNDLDLRGREFGTLFPRCVVAGTRSVLADFSLYEHSDVATKELYQAARQRSPIEVMFQLGQEAGQLFGVHMKSVVPETPDFDDSETRLQWRFKGCRAQGIEDDEVTVAFG